MAHNNSDKMIIPDIMFGTIMFSMFTIMACIIWTNLWSTFFVSPKPTFIAPHPTFVGFAIRIRLHTDYTKTFFMFFFVFTVWLIVCCFLLSLFPFSFLLVFKVSLHTFRSFSPLSFFVFCSYCFFLRSVGVDSCCPPFLPRLLVLRGGAFGNGLTT